MSHTYSLRNFSLLGLVFVLSAHIMLAELLQHFATDETNTLTATELAAIERELSEFDKETSTQLIVLIVPSLGEESIEQAALRVAEENGIGRKEKNNGVLLFVAKSDRQIRIEVGYGLEGVLTDAISGQIIRHEIVPRFRSDQFAAGINAGIESIIAATRNEYSATPSQQPSGAIALLPILLFILFFFFVSTRRSRLRGSYVPPMFYSGGSRGSGGWGGGGGFSGGGGSFGGGGASGSW